MKNTSINRTVQSPPRWALILVAVCLSSAAHVRAERRIITVSERAGATLSTVDLRSHTAGETIAHIVTLKQLPVSASHNLKIAAFKPRGSFYQVLVLASTNGGTLQELRRYRILDSTSLEWLDTPLLLPTSSRTILGLAFGDFDNDTEADVLLIEQAVFPDETPPGASPPKLMHYELTDDGLEWRQQIVVPSPLATELQAVTIGELDDDLRPDILTIERDSDESTGQIHINRYSLRVGGAELEYMETLVTRQRDLHNFQSIAVTDLDGDATPDLLVLDSLFLDTTSVFEEWYLGDTGWELYAFSLITIPPDERILGAALLRPPAPLIPIDGGNRYVRVTAPAPPVAGGGIEEAVRVRFVNLDGYPGGSPDLYLGAPSAAPEEDTGDSGKTFTAAPLDCEPVFIDWSVEGVIAIYGAEIMPGSTYEVSRAHSSCAAGALDNENCWSDPVVIETLKYGDVWPAWDFENLSAQPDFNDIAACIRKFQATPSECDEASDNTGTVCAGDGDCPGGDCRITAPLKSTAQLQPNTVFPDRGISFKDIAKDVDAFAIPTAYSDAEDGPCTCPSTVTCGAAVCATDLECEGVTDGLCADGFCRDKCGRCTP